WPGSGDSPGARCARHGGIAAEGPAAAQAEPGRSEAAGAGGRQAGIGQQACRRTPAAAGQGDRRAAPEAAGTAGQPPGRAVMRVLPRQERTAAMYCKYSPQLLLIGPHVTKVAAR